MKIRIFVAAVMAAISLSAHVQAESEADQVRHLLHKTFDKPESRLVVDPVVVAEGYAIAGWSQGDMGGRALLQSKHGRWMLILCAGDGIKSAEALSSAGIPSSAATSLATGLAKAEEKIPPYRLALFSKFEGLIRMDEAGNHPPVHHHKH